MNRQHEESGGKGFSAAHEAERLIGHYLLLTAILGEEDEAHRELARLRVRQRRRMQVLERAAEAVVA